MYDKGFRVRRKPFFTVLYILSVIGQLFSELQEPFSGIVLWERENMLKKLLQYISHMNALRYAELLSQIVA